MRSSAASLSVDDDRDRAVVDELDLHPGAEDPRSHRDAERAERIAEALDERFRLLRRRRGGEARPEALARLGEERELADDERLATSVEEGAVEATACVREDPNPGDLGSEPLRGVGPVPGGDPEQDEEARAAGADHGAVDADCGPRNPLHDGSHAGILHDGAAARLLVVDVPQTRYAGSGDVSIAYQVVGNGPFDVVLVPGFVSSVEYGWEDPHLAAFLASFASFCRLIVFDERGTRLSDRVRGVPTLETRMDDVRAIMDDVGSERAALIGYSEGASMAVRFARTYPERTIALVMYGGLLTWDWMAEARFEIRHESDQAALEEIERRWGTPGRRRGDHGRADRRSRRRGRRARLVDRARPRRRLRDRVRGARLPSALGPPGGTHALRGRLGSRHRLTARRT